MTHGIPTQTPAADPAKTVADDGGTVAGVLDRLPLDARATEPRAA
jgi:hypothetical protein